MPDQDIAKILTMAAFNLSTEDSLRGVFHSQVVGQPVPSGRGIHEIVELCRAILFPSYFGHSKISRHTVRNHIGVSVEQLFDVLNREVFAALCFAQSVDEIDPRCQNSDFPCYNCHGVEDCAFDTLKKAAHKRELEVILARDAQRAIAQSEMQGNGINASLASASLQKGYFKANEGNEASVGLDQRKSLSSIQFDVSALESQARKIAADFISSLPLIRMKLARDAKSSFFADPAASSLGEVICCYPGVRAIINYRIAHQLLQLKVPLLPRAISEMAHSETGIDIHPGAQIGDCFSIDHGTGVVIGETCIIGNNVKLFQGVTLGAKTIPVDEKGVPLKIARHPILEDDVVVYANATILGRITIGRGAVIGGNVWITESVKPGMKVVQQRARQ